MKFLKKNWREIKQKTDVPVSWWSKIRTFTVAGLFWLLPLTSCDNSKINNKITLDRDKLCVKCDIIYNFSGWGSGDPTESKNTVSFRKVGDSYMWEIFEDGWWPFNNLTSFESDNLEKVKEWISNHLIDNDKLTNKMKQSTVDKINYAVAVLDSTIQNKPLPKWGEYTIEIK